jgi:hypothetical protein
MHMHGGLCCHQLAMPQMLFTNLRRKSGSSDQPMAQPLHWPMLHHSLMGMDRPLTERTRRFNVWAI